MQLGAMAAIPRVWEEVLGNSLQRDLLDSSLLAATVRSAWKKTWSRICCPRVMASRMGSACVRKSWRIGGRRLRGLGLIDTVAPKPQR